MCHCKCGCSWSPELREDGGGPPSWRGHLQDGASASQSQDRPGEAQFHGGVIRILPSPSPPGNCFLLGDISDSPISPIRFDVSPFTVPPTLLTRHHQHFSPTPWDGDHSSPNTYVPSDHVLLLDEDHIPHMAMTPAPSTGPGMQQIFSK